MAGSAVCFRLVERCWDAEQQTLDALHIGCHGTDSDAHSMAPACPGDWRAFPARSRQPPQHGCRPPRHDPGLLSARPQHEQTYRQDHRELRAKLAFGRVHWGNFMFVKTSLLAAMPASHLDDFSDQPFQSPLHSLGFFCRPFDLPTPSCRLVRVAAHFARAQAAPSSTRRPLRVVVGLPEFRRRTREVRRTTTLWFPSFVRVPRRPDTWASEWQETAMDRGPSSQPPLRTTHLQQ